MKVHQKLGPGFQEAIYHKALAIELGRAGLSYVSELSHAVEYDGVVIGERRADFVVAEAVVVELKATSNLTDLHLVQTKNYAAIFGYPTGLLINFGARSLEYKLVFNPRSNALSRKLG